MPDRPAPDDATNGLRSLRERVAAGIALPIVLLFLVLLCIDFVHELGDFSHVKDLFGFLSPFVGIVLGYYFNKVTSEARAESAEDNARSANEVAKTTAGSLDAATDLAKQADDARVRIEARAHALQGGLSELMLAAAKLMPARTDRIRAPEEAAAAVPDAYAELRAAMDRASALIG